MNSQSNNSYAAYVGIDWADTKHDICIQAADSEDREWDINGKMEKI